MGMRVGFNSRNSRHPASWRNPSITCSKEEAISALKAIRQQIVNEGGSVEAFRRLAEKESDCNRWGV